MSIFVVFFECSIDSAHVVEEQVTSLVIRIWGWCGITFFGDKLEKNSAMNTFDLEEDGLRCSYLKKIHKWLVIQVHTLI